MIKKMNILKIRKISLLTFSVFISLLVFSSGAFAVNGQCLPAARDQIQNRGQQASEVDDQRRKAYEEKIEESTTGQIWDELKNCASLPSVPRGPRFPSLSGILDGIKDKACSVVRNQSNEQINNRTRGIFDVNIPQLPDEVRGITGGGTVGIGDIGNERDVISEDVSNTIERIKRGYEESRNYY